MEVFCDHFGYSFTIKFLDLLSHIDGVGSDCVSKCGELDHVVLRKRHQLNKKAI